MKTTLLVLILFFSLCSFGQIPDYFANNPTWSCSKWNSNGGGITNETFDHFTYYLGADTNILSNTYHKLHRRGYRDSVSIPGIINYSFDEFTGISVRQLNRSIRYCSPFVSDSLLVNYDFMVGDLLQGGVFNNCPSMNPIQKIDSVLINTEYRRVFYLDSIIGPIITEGIGHQTSVNGTIGEMFLDEWGGIGYDNYLNCYGQNETPYWGSQGTTGNCILNLELNELDKKPKELIQIFDVMGRVSEEIPNTLLLYLFSDGTLEKVFIVK